MRACVHACMRACVHACMRACVHACTCACTRAGVRMRVRACVRAGVRRCVLFILLVVMAAFHKFEHDLNDLNTILINVLALNQ